MFLTLIITLWDSKIRMSLTTLCITDVQYHILLQQTHLHTHLHTHSPTHTHTHLYLHAHTYIHLWEHTYQLPSCTNKGDCVPLAVPITVWSSKSGGGGRVAGSGRVAVWSQSTLTCLADLPMGLDIVLTETFYRLPLTKRSTNRTLHFPQCLYSHTTDLATFLLCREIL